MAFAGERGIIIRVEDETFIPDVLIVGGKPGSEENFRAHTIYTGPDHATKMRQQRIKEFQLKGKTGKAEEPIL